MSIKNVKIRFNLDKENDRRAYEYLQSAEKSYSKAVISAICGFMDLSEKAATEDVFLEKVISTIREEVAKSNPFGGLLQFVQTPSAQTPSAQTPSAQTPAEKENNAETEEAVLNFLDSF